MNIQSVTDLYAAMPNLDDEAKGKLVCSLIGHSNIVETCIGYVFCARCGDQIGDALGSVYNGSHVVIVGHDCDICRANSKGLTWRDTFLVKTEKLPSGLVCEAAGQPGGRA